MKFIRSLPEMWARTRWPFSSSTANIVLGNGSITVPSTSIASFLATGSGVPFLVPNAGPGGPAHERAAYQIGLIRANRGRRALDRRENHRARGRHGDRVLQVGGQRAIAGDDRQVIGQHRRVG